MILKHLHSSISTSFNSAIDPRLTFSFVTYIMRHIYALICFNRDWGFDTSAIKPTARIRNEIF